MTGPIGRTPAIKNITNIGGFDIGCLPDPAHGFKNSKSFFMRYNGVELPQETVEKYDLSYNVAHFYWVKRLIEFNEQLGEKKVPVPKNLNRKMCLNYSKYAQMDVKPALAIYNFATADAIDYMVKHEGWSDEASATAVYIRLWARWYQIVGAYTPEDGFDVEKPVDRQEKIDFLIFFKKFYGGCKYLGGVNHISLWGNQKHIILICETVVYVQDRLLKDKNVGIFLPGYLMCNSVENLHTDVRRINPFPTPRIYKYILRGIAMTQMLGESVKGSSYQLDHGKEWLVGFSDRKKLLDQADPEEAADLSLFEEVERFSWDMHPTADMIISFIGGGVLAKVLTKPNCVKCITFWEETSETSNHILNALIECKEYAPDALVRPSDIAHLIFQYIDDLFEGNREKELEKKGLVDAFLIFVMEKVSERYENIPDCHFKAIVKKSITWKWYHYTNFLNSEYLEVNRYEIEQEANASKTSKARSLINPVTGPAKQDWQDPARWQELRDDLDPGDEIPEWMRGRSFYRDDRTGMDSEFLDLDSDMVDDQGNVESVNKNGHENVDAFNENILETVNSPNHLDLDVDMADSQGIVNENVSELANSPELVDRFNENVSETVKTPNHLDLDFDMANGQGNVGKVNKKFKFKKFVGGKENVNTFNENISETARSSNHPDLDSGMADGQGSVDTVNTKFNFKRLADSQENFKWVGNKLVMASSPDRVDEVRDNVSGRADLPEVDEVIPQPVFAPQRAQSFADVGDFYDHIGGNGDHELSDSEI